jgi:NADP-dependent alcohol dehydrogenase
VANEVAFALNVRKMVATAAVIAAVWRRICSGDSRWGDRACLEDFWSRVAHTVALPLEPHVGIAALIDRWGIPFPRRPTAHQVNRIAVTIEAAWGDRSPMLRGLVAEDFCDVLRDSSWTPPSRLQREEVM